MVDLSVTTCLCKINVQTDEKVAEITHVVFIPVYGGGISKHSTTALSFF